MYLAGKIAERDSKEEIQKHYDLKYKQHINCNQNPSQFNQLSAVKDTND